MAIILFILAVGVLLTSIYSFFQTKQKPRDYHKNNRLFSDAWKRIGSEKTKVNNSRKILPRETPNHYKNDGDNFLSDLILRTFKSRRNYYTDVYLKSAAWQRKRFVVLRRDNWSCVHCGRPATQVHHKKYAYKIGKEPIEWLESVCNACHDSLH